MWDGTEPVYKYIGITRQLQEPRAKRGHELVQAQKRGEGKPTPDSRETEDRGQQERGRTTSTLQKPSSPGAGATDINPCNPARIPYLQLVSRSRLLCPPQHTAAGFLRFS